MESPRKAWHISRPRWHHPAVRAGDRLTPGERAADALRDWMGSWWFVLGAVAFLAGWMLGNRGSGFDPYPFILLNLVLSCVAALQGAILLIAGKRGDQISADLADHDYQTDLEAAAAVGEIRSLVGELHQRWVTDPEERSERERS